MLEIYQTYQPNVIGPSPLLLVLVIQGLVTYIYSYQGSLQHRFCTTLLYIKDVTLKEFLCGCRPTRLNHITLVFSMFLFYASPSASTLAYTTWHLIHHVVNNIFNTLSEPNFILSIKQTSLASKEDSHVHTTI